MNTVISERHLEFMKECWKRGISDSLISTIVPVGNSQVSKIRKTYKFQPYARYASKQSIFDLFDILRDKRFSYMISCSNPLRTKNNVEFWERHKDMFEYFMELRNNALKDDTLWEEINPDEVPLEEVFKLEEEATVESEAVEENVCSVDAPEAKEDESTWHTVPKECVPKDYIKQELKSLCSMATLNEYYELAHDILNVLEEDF